MTSETGRIFEMWQDGLLTTAERDERLDRIQVRGDDQPDGRYVGYDYANQSWLVFWPATAGVSHG